MRLVHRVFYNAAGATSQARALKYGHGRRQRPPVITKGRGRGLLVLVCLRCLRTVAESRIISIMESAGDYRTKGHIRGRNRGNVALLRASSVRLTWGDREHCAAIK